MSATLKAALDHYRAQARLAQFERMREALREIVEVADTHPFCSVGHLVEHGNVNARAVLRDVEGL